MGKVANIHISDPRYDPSRPQYCLTSSDSTLFFLLILPPSVIHSFSCHPYVHSTVSDSPPSVPYPCRRRSLSSSLPNDWFAFARLESRERSLANATGSDKLGIYFCFACYWYIRYIRLVKMINEIEEHFCLNGMFLQFFGWNYGRRLVICAQLPLRRGILALSLI